MESNLKIKIIDSGSSLYWYNWHVGEIFDVIKTEENLYWVREPEGYLNFVLREDAEIWKLN